MSADKLTSEEQRDWEKKITEYALFVSLGSDVTNGVLKVVQETTSNDKVKEGVYVSCDAIVTGLQKVYDIFKSADDQVKKGQKPDFFTDTVPFPSRPPSLPADGNEISSFPLIWKTITDGLDLAALHSSKLATLMTPIKAAGDKLVEDLDKYFKKE